MKSALLALVALLGSSSLAPAEPLRLTDAQLDRITAGAEIPIGADPIAAIVEGTLVKFNTQAAQRLQTVFASPVVRQGVAFTDPNQTILPLIRGFKSAFKKQLDITLGLIEALRDDGSAEANGVAIERPQFDVRRGGSSSGGVFDATTGVGGASLVGSARERIPVVAFQTPPSAP